LEALPAAREPAGERLLAGEGFLWVRVLALVELVLAASAQAAPSVPAQAAVQVSEPEEFPARKHGEDHAYREGEPVLLPGICEPRFRFV
jgi:hypothetical protein